MDYKKPSAILVLDLINKDNGTNITFDDILLYGVKKNTDGDPIRDTRIECKAIEGSPYYGTQYFTYSRVDIGKYFEDYGTVRIPPNRQKKTSDLLPYLNRHFNLALDVNDIEDHDLGSYILPHIVNIKPRESNFAWIGNVNVVISDPAFELGNILDNNKLNGLVNPDDTEAFDLSLYSTKYDFTKASLYLREIIVGDMNNAELADIFNGFVEQIWDIYNAKVKWNWKNSVVIYNNIVKSEYTTRTDISHVLVINISKDWFLGKTKGYILMHYNK